MLSICYLPHVLAIMCTHGATVYREELVEHMQLLEAHVVMQGWLEWTDLDLLKKNTHLTVMGPTALVFCYANSVTQAPSHYFEADYLGAALLKIPDKGNIEEAFLAQSSSYQLPYEPEQKLAAQTPEEERALWHSLSDQS